MNCYFCLNGIDHNINNNNELLALKGASTITAATSTNISISQEEVDLIRNAINIGGFYVTRNPQVFQQPEEIIRKLTESWNILASKENNNNNSSSNNSAVKGASNNNNSNNNLCPTKIEHFKELLNFLFH